MACVLLPNFRATAGSSMARRNGSPRRPGGIVKVRISYAWGAGPRLTLHLRKGFPSSRSNALHPVSSSSAQSSPWVTARISPQFGFDNVSAPRHNLLGEEGGSLALTAASFTGTAALVGIFGV